MLESGLSNRVQRDALGGFRELIPVVLGGARLSDERDYEARRDGRSCKQTDADGTDFSSRVPGRCGRLVKFNA